MDNLDLGEVRNQTDNLDLAKVRNQMDNLDLAKVRNQMDNLDFAEVRNLCLLTGQLGLSMKSDRQPRLT